MNEIEWKPGISRVVLGTARPRIKRTYKCSRHRSTRRFQQGSPQFTIHDSEPREPVAKVKMNEVVREECPCWASGATRDLEEPDRRRMSMPDQRMSVLANLVAGQR